MHNEPKEQTYETQQQMAEYAERLTHDVDALFREIADPERIHKVSSNAQDAALLFQRLYTMMVGVLGSLHGHKRTLEIMREVFKREQQHWRETRDQKIKVVTGWMGRL